jgi:cytochrome b561
MRSGGALLLLGTLALLWPDSARTKNPIAKMAANQKINRAALDIFILVVLFCAPAYGISLCRTAADALRFSNRNIAQAPAKKASRIFKHQRQTYQPKGNRPVTSEM